MSDPTHQPNDSFKENIEENKQAAAGTPKYGCLMLKIPLHDASKISKWSDDNIDIKDLDEQGIEREIHVTVLYGFEDSVTSSDIQSVIKDEYKKDTIDIELKDISRFDSKTYDVLKMDVDSKDLVDLNKLLKKHFGDKIHSTYPDYHPHLTLAYINKGACKDLNGNGKFAGSVYSLSDLVYSDSGMKKTDFKIGAVTTKKDAAFIDVSQSIDGGNAVLENGSIAGDVSGVMAHTSDDASSQQPHHQTGVTTMHSSDPNPLGTTGIPGMSASEEVTKTDPSPNMDNRDVYEMEQDTRHKIEQAGLPTKGASISDFHWKVAASPSRKKPKRVFKVKSPKAVQSIVASQEAENDMLEEAQLEGSKPVIKKRNIGERIAAAISDDPAVEVPTSKTASIGSVLAWPHFGGGGLTGAMGATALMAGLGAGAGAIHHGVNKLYAKGKAKFTGEEEDEDPNNGMSLGDRMSRYALLGGLSVPVVRGFGALMPGVDINQAAQANAEALKDPNNPLHPDAQFVKTEDLPKPPETPTPQQGAK